jgi:hypothetical protein
MEQLQLQQQQLQSSLISTPPTQHKDTKHNGTTDAKDSSNKESALSTFTPNQWVYVLYDIEQLSMKVLLSLWNDG